MNIHIAPLKFSNTALAERVTEEVTRIFPYYNVKKIILPVDVTSSFSKERSQYFSTQILAEASKHTADLNDKVILITELDLFIPVLTFVFGEAQLNGKHSIVSVCRLHEEFYSGLSNDDLLFERTMKEVLHELGHNFGLIHCINWDCVMHSSPGIEEVDIKGNSYCSSCFTGIKLKSE